MNAAKKTAKAVTPWTQSEYRYHPPEVQVKQKVILALPAWSSSAPLGLVSIHNIRRLGKQTLAAKPGGVEPNGEKPAANGGRRRSPGRLRF